jgi:hypothetical protein
VDGSNFFNRSWYEFKAGFGDTSGNYWLGNELLHLLSKNNQYKLHFDLQSDNTGLWYVAEYSTFTVTSEADNYTLNAVGFSGNASFSALDNSNRMQFSTWDRNNDRDPGGVSCALTRGGGFWYRRCAGCNVNTVRGMSRSFSWRELPGGKGLRTSRMWLMCR